MPSHDFVLVSEIPEKISYRDFSKAEMTKISDEFILEFQELSWDIEMYNHNLANKIMGLDYYGRTILDINMAQRLKDKLIANCKPCNDLTKLIQCLEQAISEKKYVIHFGI